MYVNLKVRKQEERGIKNKTQTFTDKNSDVFLSNKSEYEKMY